MTKFDKIDEEIREIAEWLFTVPRWVPLWSIRDLSEQSI